MKYTLCIVISVLVSTVGWTQSDEPLSTDRPGEGTDASTVVGAGVWQIELGLFREWEADEDNAYWNYPSALLRYGVTNAVEVRLSSGLFTDPTVSGVRWAPVNLATKVAITEQRRWLPQIALLVGLTLPQTGSEVAQPRFTEPNIALLMDHAISDWFGITTNVGVGWGSESPAATYRYALSFNAGLSSRIGSFVEFYGNLPEASPDSHLVNGGFTLLLSPNVQLDLSGGTALSGYAADFYTALGASFRW